MRNTQVFKGVPVALTCFVSICGYAMADAPKQIDVPPGDLSTALELISKQAGVELVFQPEQIKGRHTYGVSGALSSQDAVRKLLEGTQLQLLSDDATGAMMIGTPAPATPRKAGSAGDRSLPASEKRKGVQATGSGGKSTKSFWSRFRLAQAQIPAAGDGSGAQGSEEAAASSTGERSSRTVENKSANLAEVVVTAQKRSENLQDVPLPVSVITGSELLESNKLRLSDYFSQIPGLSFNKQASGVSTISIRGLSTGVFTNATVGVTVDDVPFGSGRAQVSSTVSELDPSDLARVEVLRGPQGTLYGASSLGGLINYVTADPTLSSVHGRVVLGTQVVKGGDGLGSNLYGSVNVPVGSQFALRASGFSRKDPGYVDNPVLGIDGVNEFRTHGGRLAALWTPSDAFSVKLSALFQKAKQNGTDDIQLLPHLGDSQQEYRLGVGATDAEQQFYIATIKGKLGIVDLTSVTGYAIARSDSLEDQDAFLGSFLNGFSESVLGPDVPDNSTIVAQTRLNDQHVFSQELRAVIPIREKFDLLLGAYYSREVSSAIADTIAADPATMEARALWARSDFATGYDERAAFGNLTIHFTDKLDLQIGGRRARIEQTRDDTDTGPGVSLVYPDATSSPFVRPQLVATENVTTYLFTPSYKFSDSLMGYLRIASGYRPGGSNAPGASPTYSADQTESYEVGFKGALLDGILSFDTSVYNIDWKDIQLSSFLDIYPFTDNGSRARSRGVELSVQAKATQALTLSGWIALNDAKLTGPFPPTATLGGESGDRLPAVSRVSGSLSATQRFPLTSSLDAYVSGTFTYVGSREGSFTAIPFEPPFIAPPRETYAGYATFDLRSGFDYDLWTLNLYATNVLDRRGVLSGGAGSGSLVNAFNFIKPRQIGLQVSRSF